MSKKTLVLGASLKEERYSNIAIYRLRKFNIETVAIGLREGLVDDVKIHKELIPFQGINTVTLYLNAQRQPQYYDYIISLYEKTGPCTIGCCNLDYSSPVLFYYSSRIHYVFLAKFKSFIISKNDLENVHMS